MYKICLCSRFCWLLLEQLLVLLQLKLRLLLEQSTCQDLVTDRDSTTLVIRDTEFWVNDLLNLNRIVEMDHRKQPYPHPHPPLVHMDMENE